MSKKKPSKDTEELHRKRALEAAKRNKMLDLTLDIVEKHKLGISPRRTYE